MATQLNEDNPNLIHRRNAANINSSNNNNYEESQNLNSSTTTDHDRTKNETNQSNDDQEEETPQPNPQFCCNICLDSAKDPVVSQCGHLFCWPCLHRWLEIRPDRQECPVCKSHVTKAKCTPIYGHGDDSTKDPRESVPPRPQGRQEQRQRRNESPFGGIFGGWGGDNNRNGWDTHNSGFQFNFSLFPLGLFGGGFSMGGGHGAMPAGLSNDGNGRFRTQNQNHPDHGNAQQRQQNQQSEAENELIQNFFLWLAMLFLIWFLLSE